MDKAFKRVGLLIIPLILAFSVMAYGEDIITGKLTDISDEDFITVLQNDAQQKIRLYGIACPQGQQDFSKKAKQYISDLASDKEIKVVQQDLDQNGFRLGMVYAGDVCVNEEIIKNGLGWVYQQYCDKPVCQEWLKLEEEAKTNKIGLWSHPNPTPPWDYKKAEETSKLSPANDKSDLTGYYGNVHTKIFHRPGCKYYHSQNFLAYFKTRNEAVSRGFKPCEFCKP